MRFKYWFYLTEIGGSGPGIEPAKQMIPITASPGIFDGHDDPPRPTRTATKGYVQTARSKMKKK